MLKAFVINRHGQPLMPCSLRKARLLLKDGKAKVKHRPPFTIQPLYGSSCYKQPVILGVDAGSKTVGLSASTQKEELFKAEMTPLDDIVDLISTRRELRRSRLNCKTRYRKARFNNRVLSKKKGCLAPSVEVKIQEHITIIRRICNILPVSKVVVETAEFDMQLLKAVQAGEKVPIGEDYQKGEMYRFYNTLQYVLWRDGYTCKHCGGKKKEVKLYIHHLTSRKTGGNAPNNLLNLCEACHKAYHSGYIDTVGKRTRRSTKYAAFMGIMRKTLMSRLCQELQILVAETKGYITKLTREKLLFLPKSHTNDALAIAQGIHGFQCSGHVIQSDKTYIIKPVRHYNRQLHKATFLKGVYRKSNQASKYVFGFQLFDKVRWEGQYGFILGRRCAFDIRKLDGTVLNSGISYKKLQLVERSSNYLID